MNYRTKKGQELLSNKIEGYFQLCDSKNSEENSKYAVKPYTMSGLLYHLDMSEAELNELEQIRALSRIIGSAKRRIEAYIEENALSGRLASTAAINSLKTRFGRSEQGTEPCGLQVILDEQADRLGV